MGWKEKGCSPVPLVGKGYRPVSAVTPLFRHGEGYSAPPPLGLLGWYCASKTSRASCASRTRGAAWGLGKNKLAEWCPGGSASSAARRGAAGASEGARGKGAGDWHIICYSWRWLLVCLDRQGGRARQGKGRGEETLMLQCTGCTCCCLPGRRSVGLPSTWLCTGLGRGMSN